MSRRSISLFAIGLLLLVAGCAVRVYHPLRSTTFEVRGPNGERTVRAATPQEVTFLDAWLKGSIDLPWRIGKISNADVTATMIVLLPAPAELYLQVGPEDVVVYRKGEYRYRLTREEMAEFRRALGLPPGAMESVPR